MKKVANEAAVRAGKPGAFAFEVVTEGDATFKRMWVHLPSGFVGAFNLEPTPAHVPFSWPWNGSVAKPTIGRRILLREQWSGQIKDGKMISDPAGESVSTLVEVMPPPPSPVRAAVKQAMRSRTKSAN
ncbi:MAG TPA: hypothetical protein VGD45_20740 [Steroidobacter sp.]|uniref:hypothetical protein n=1 Tax=Steroidobacter sp. TaxID=1978227 RepID=UPI002ED7BB55